MGAFCGKEYKGVSASAVATGAVVSLAADFTAPPCDGTTMESASLPEKINGFSLAPIFFAPAGARAPSTGEIGERADEKTADWLVQHIFISDISDRKIEWKQLVDVSVSLGA
mmetsp:Transcript_26374/g.77978  ORF Transcript_26374/g.77978 Transcript_26374/m.77978 type:complete len:112 (+) Transcript_26374:177-512(+)